MNLIPIQAIGNDQKLVSAEMAQCEQCPGTAFRILVINGHNHLECLGCGTSYCQGDCCESAPANEVNHNSAYNGPMGIFEGM